MENNNDRNDKIDVTIPIAIQDGGPSFTGSADSGSQDLTEDDLTVDGEVNLEGTDNDNLSDEERSLLYNKAVSFWRKGSNNHALLCFLGCLKGLQSSSKFSMLPQCMTNISKIYAEAGDYTKAVQFMQGTKLYYETAIIEAGATVDQYKKESGNGNEYKPLDLDACLDDAKRANEYERLSHACLKQRKFQLALEYSGKATKLRQQVYGDEHSVTVQSLDLFTVIYAEMGKQQYSEAMEKYSDNSQVKDEEQAGVIDDERKAEREESSIDKSTRRVHFQVCFDSSMFELVFITLKEHSQ